MIFTPHILEKLEKRKNSNGYVEAWYPEHPHAVEGWMLYHRLVMENHLNRYLELSSVVHHVNEIKTCNEIWNLWLTTPKEHTIIHRLGAQHKKSSRGSMSKRHRKISKTRTRDHTGKYVKETPRD